MNKDQDNNPQITQMNADRRDPQTHAIIGAAMEVHGQMGPGFLEAVYQEALAIEFAARAIPFSREVELPVFYKGLRLTCSYRADFVCHETVVVELKAIQALTGVEESQVLNYLKATRIERGLLLNFGRTRLEFKRFIFPMSERNPPMSKIDTDIKSAFIRVICG